MLILYQAGGGSRDVHIGDPVMDGDQWNGFLGVIRKLLLERGSQRAHDLLMELPFRLHEGTNGFGDSFDVLCFRASIKQYVAMEQDPLRADDTSAYGTIGRAVSQVLGRHVRFVAVEMEIEPPSGVVPPAPKQSGRKTVQQALQDSESLLASQGAPSAVDRIHTALHGVLAELCDDASIQHPQDTSVTGLFATLKKAHPAFQIRDAHDEQTVKIVRGLAGILDALSPIRNNGSLAHPNEALLKEPEAQLAINAARTIFLYLDAKCNP